MLSHEKGSLCCQGLSDHVKIGHKDFWLQIMTKHKYEMIKFTRIVLMQLSQDKLWISAIWLSLSCPPTSSFYSVVEIHLKVFSCCNLVNTSQCISLQLTSRFFFWFGQWRVGTESDLSQRHPGSHRSNKGKIHSRIKKIYRFHFSVLGNMDLSIPKAWWPWP